MSSALDATRRFLALFLKTELPPDAFSETEVWLYAPALLDWAEAGKPLPPDAAALLPQLSTAMNLPIGAPAALVAQVLEQHFGPCPFGPERLAMFAEYLRRQRNGVFSAAPKRRGPNLTGE